MQARKVIIDVELVSLLDAVTDLPVAIMCVEIQNNKLTGKTFSFDINDDVEPFLEFIRHADIYFLHTQKNIRTLNTWLACIHQAPLKTFVNSISNIASLARTLVPTLDNHSLPGLSQYFKLAAFDEKSLAARARRLAEIYLQLAFLQNAQAHHKYAPALRNPLLDRCNTAETFIDAEKEVHPLKTAILIDQSILPLKKTKKFAAGLARIHTHRDIAAITAYSEQHSPIEVTTAHHTRLRRAESLGAITIFSNHPGLKAQTKVKTQLEQPEAFYQSAQYKEIKKIHDAHKTLQVQVTPESLANAKAARYQDAAQLVKKTFAPRGTLMVNAGPKPAQATAYANATQLFSDKLKWEWLPLIGPMILGAQTEQSQNVVAGTANAATWLMLNHSVHTLAKSYPDGFTLTVDAALIKDTHIASSLTYTIQTTDFTLPLTFNLQTENRPHLCYETYLQQVVEALVEMAKTKLTQKDLCHASDKAMLFFKKIAAEPAAPAAALSSNHHYLRSKQ